MLQIQCPTLLSSIKGNSFCGLLMEVLTAIGSIHHFLSALKTQSRQLRLCSLFKSISASFINFICMPICNICFWENPVFYLSIQNVENATTGQWNVYYWQVFWQSLCLFITLISMNQWNVIGTHACFKKSNFLMAFLLF